MSDAERYFHETWLGMVQPIDGLVVSIPVLIDAQCMERQPPHVQAKLVELCPATREGEAGPEGYTIADLQRFLFELLGYSSTSFDTGDALPEALSLYVPEGRQTLRATVGLKKPEGPPKAESADATPASLAGAAYDMLVWELPTGLDFDKPESVTGSWDYPPSAKLDRLLRHCRVPIGLLTNHEAVRMIYAPHGESSGTMTFRIDDMASVGGRPILDAFIMLLSANRFFGVADDRTLPAILAESRKRQANVTNDLAGQVFEALQILLRGFEFAAERDGRHILDDALAREGDHLYKGLLTVLLRLVFLLYAEDRSLLPVEHDLYAEHLSVLSLFDQLQADRGAYPDSMSHRFGAWGRLVTLFRAVFLGVSCGDLQMPPRHGALFNPHEYPFLEGWGPAGSAPITQPEGRAAVRLPTVDDETMLRVLEKLLLFEGQRLSYRALDVEQIGSVYEALMGYHVLRVPSAAVCMKPNRLWVSAEEVLEVPAARRAKWLKETVGLSTAQGEKLGEDLREAKGDAVLEALAKHATGSKKAEPWLSRAKAGQLVLQPGTERRRTSSHYTPRSLSTPIVRRTLEPLLAVMGEAPSSERILSLKICDPAMGSGAFLVEACRFLADHVLAAWTREGMVADLAAAHGDPLLHARRLVAQRCLYGVDKNQAAVELAKLSLWLVTLSRTLPFTFLDHSLRHGDSLVGLDFDQIRNFHWKRPEKEAPQQLELFDREIASALEEAIKLRQKIGELGDSPVDDGEKARLFWDSQDALDRVRLIADLVVGAFFAREKDRERESERATREGLVRAWLGSGEAVPDVLLAMQREVRELLPVFHWMVEFPEVFHAGRPDPLEDAQVNREAFMEAFVGNPPFLGHKFISAELGDPYRDWLFTTHDESAGKTDLCAHFFRRTHSLLGTNGTCGLIATNTIAQGDTRESGLKVLCERGARIYDCSTDLPWSGDAAVLVSVVHYAVGNVVGAVDSRLNGVRVQGIDSWLRLQSARPEACPLIANSDVCYGGVDIGGNGFVVGKEERDSLIERNGHNARLVLPYIGGEDVNTNSHQDSERYVIHFGSMRLGELEGWPDLVAIVRARVKPHRDTLRDNPDGRRLKESWWLFNRTRAEMFSAIAPLRRCLVTAVYTKHLCFSFQPCDRVFNNKLHVFALDGYAQFAVLQSRVHSPWAWRLSSTLKADLAYTPSKCFETFPFPHRDPRTILPTLEDVGQRLYDFRAKYMVDENVGLTITYNRLKDGACTDVRIFKLRRLHEEMDRAVLAAYAEGDPEGRWTEVEVPPYCPMSDGDRAMLQRFEDAVVDRLFVLNGKRAEEEGRATSSAMAAKKRAPKGVRKAEPDQLSMTREPRDTSG